MAVVGERLSDMTSFLVEVISELLPFFLFIINSDQTDVLWRLELSVIVKELLEFLNILLPVFHDLLSLDLHCLVIEEVFQLLRNLVLTRVS